MDLKNQIQNREIKFRAMTKANNVMVFGDLIVCPNGEHRILWFEMKGELPLDVDYNYFNEVVQSSTVGQFTGLLDRNGKEIYYGDVIKHDLGHEMFTKLNWQVVFEFGAFQLRNPLYDLPISFVYHAFASIENGSIISDEEYNNHLEIIGNIYENPNLIN